MSNFKVGDIIKRENGKNTFKVVKIRTRGRRFGDIKIENLDTGNIYWDFSDGGRRGRPPFMLWFKEIEPKKIKNLKFDFKNGI